MKKLICGMAMLLSGNLMFGQNTFPSSGNVGIGTSSPSQPLQVEGNTTLKGDLEMYGDRYIYNVHGTPSKGYVRFYNNVNTNGEEKIMLYAPGSVQFVGDISFQNKGSLVNTQGEYVWQINEGITTHHGIPRFFGIHRPIYSNILTGTSGEPLYPNFFSSKDMEISFSGNSTGGPFKYSVTRNDGTGNRTALLNISTTGDFTIGQAGTALRVTPDNANGNVALYPQTTSADLYLNAAVGGTGNTYLHAANAGYVGIGTNAPSQRLHVSGSFGVTGSIKGLETNGALDLYAASWIHDGSYLQLFAKDHTSNPGQVWITSGYNASGTGSDNAIVFGTKVNASDTDFNRNEHMVIHADGRVKIGAEPVPAGYKLAVEEGIVTEKLKIAVAGTADWSDYVFASDYQLMPIEDLRKYVAAAHHLPGVPSAEEVVANGIDVGKMDAKLLEKIEELTLYILALEEKVKEIQANQNK